MNKIALFLVFNTLFAVLGEAFSCDQLLTGLRQQDASSRGNWFRTRYKKSGPVRLADDTVITIEADAKLKIPEVKIKVPRWIHEDVKPEKLIDHAEQLKPNEVEVIPLYSGFILIAKNKVYYMDPQGNHEYKSNVTAKITPIDRSNAVKMLSWYFEKGDDSKVFGFRPKRKGFRFELEKDNAAQLDAKLQNSEATLGIRDFNGAHNFVVEKFVGASDQLMAIGLTTSMAMIISLANIPNKDDEKDDDSKEKKEATDIRKKDEKEK